MVVNMVMIHVFSHLLQVHMEFKNKIYMFDEW